MCFRFGLVVATVVSFAAISPAQVRNITLDQAWAIGLENNISVIQAQNNIQAAQSTVKATYGTYLPSLSASGGWNRYQNDRPGTAPIFVGGIEIPGTTGFSVENNFQAGLNLNMVLFDGFSREGALGQATANAISSEHTSSRTRQTLVYQVEQMYLNVLRTGRLVVVEEENLKRDQRQLERITESNRVGALSLADVYRQQSQVAADEFSIINAQNEHDKAIADLISLIGLEVSGEYAFSDSSLDAAIRETDREVTNPRAYDFQALADSALAHRPDYRLVQEGLNASESGVKAARGGYFPTVSAGAGYNLSSNEFSELSENRTLSWGLNLSWNIFNGWGTDQLVESASVGRRNAEIALVQKERDVRVEVKKALLDIEAARKQCEVTQKGLISATEDLRIQEERYNLGAGTLLDLLVANANYVTAEANKVNATYSFIAAKKNLEYVLGYRTY